MNTAYTLPGCQVTRAVSVLSHPGLIRLVSEIDDNGPIPRYMLTRTLSGLTRHQIRRAVDTAREHHLVDAEHALDSCYLLTEAGKELADVYDSVARWARAHNYPATASDFVTRIQETLALLTDRQIRLALSGPGPVPREGTARELPDAALLPSAGAAQDLHVPWTALSRWLLAHPHVGSAAAREASGVAAADEVEPAA
ncbi:hypothetical protein [Streptomyces sp. NPDC056244]|uniref:hypothetical protein n=1 Tax=Streptomyces sp. NPDC056244 TaxID=3345762 RepID=UPI0035DAEEF2